MSCEPCYADWVAALAREHVPALAAVAEGEGLTGDAALDAVQEGFRTFLQNPWAREPGARGDEARRYLVALVRNAARNLRRRHHRARPHVPIGEADAGLAPTPEEVVGVAEEQRQLAGCVSQLAEGPRRVVELRLLEEATGEEAARALGLSPGHVAVLLHRAKKDLYRCMTE